MTLADFPVSLTFIAVCAAMLLPFTSWIGLYRGSTSILRGDGGDPVLFKRSRIHGNFIETAPLIALVLFAAEGLGAPAFWLWLTVALFAVGRITHFMLYDNKMRGAAMALTVGPGFCLGLWVIWKLWVA
jgi:uncharacterized protein